MSKLLKHKEMIKTILIAVLVLSAVLLAGKAGYYSAISDKLRMGAGASDEGSLAADNIESFTGLRPFAVAVKPEDGGMLCVRYSYEEMTLTYSRLSVLLAEAIDSITTITKTDEPGWRNAIKNQSAYFCFYFRIPMSLLALNLGVSDAELEGISATEILLSNEYGTTTLYFRDGADTYYACETDMGSSALSSAIEQFEGASASFAYEDEAHQKLAPYTIISQSDYEISYLTATSAFSDSFDCEPIFSSCGINSKVMKSYPENSGTVFVENNKTLRMNRDGSASFSITSNAGEESGKAGAIDIVSAVNLAVGLTSKVIAPNTGDASLVLSGVSFDEETSSYTITMEYTVNGILVSLKSGESAVTIVVQNGRIEKASFRALSFAVGRADTSVLASAQAVAIADARGGYLRLSYAEDATGAFACKWVVD